MTPSRYDEHGRPKDFKKHRTKPMSFFSFGKANNFLEDLDRKIDEKIVGNFVDVRDDNGDNLDSFYEQGDVNKDKKYEEIKRNFEKENGTIKGSNYMSLKNFVLLKLLLFAFISNFILGFYSLFLVLVVVVIYLFVRKL